jgi:hypothetical protein
MRVYANGKQQKSFLTLSEDKFTLYLTTERKTNSRSSLTSFLFGKSNNTTFKERAIDIGAIDRIQRGQATKRFEMARCVSCTIVCSLCVCVVCSSVLYSSTVECSTATAAAAAYSPNQTKPKTQTNVLPSIILYYISLYYTESPLLRFPRRLLLTWNY